VAVISEIPGASSKAAWFHTPSTLDAIRKLARAWRESLSLPLIGVVGAVGKTTTKELLASILEGHFQSVLRTEGSQNGFLGIPITLLDLKPETTAGVIEIGIDEIGAMEQHLRLVEPTQVVLTRTGPEHLHQLKTLEIAAEEELKAFDWALERRIPIALNLQDSFVKAWYLDHKVDLSSSPHFTYSLNAGEPADFLGSYSPDSGTLTLTHQGRSQEFLCPLPGEHHAQNLLAALVVSHFFKLTETEIKAGLSNFKTAYGRTEIHDLPMGIRVIGDYYNSNPTSLEAALHLLASSKGPGRTHAALGDMLELGDGEESFHRGFAPLLSKLGIEKVWLYGPRMKWLHDSLIKIGFSGSRHFESLDGLSNELKKSLAPGDRVLIKGSRGMRMESVLKALKLEGTPL
jgi:UDP-N-acetylmuramoyl-tripeptide--D-alanyl-D-alanine ligase